MGFRSFIWEGVQADGASHVMQVAKNPPPSAGDAGLIPGSGRLPGAGHGNPNQYSCLEKFHGQRSQVGYSPWSRKESDTTKVS